MNPETANLELLTALAQVGLVLAFFAIAAYFAALGYLAGRPSRIEKAILHRALKEATISPDPLVAAKQRKLLHRLEPAPES